MSRPPPAPPPQSPAKTVEMAGDSLIVFGLMGVQVVLVLGHVRAPAAHAFAVHLEHVGGQPFGPGRFVLAEHALVRFHVCVQVPFQAPVVYARPRTERAAVPLLEVLPGALALGFRRGHHRRRGRRRARRRHDRVHRQNGVGSEHHLHYV